MKSCVFDNEEFPEEILKLAKEQLTLIKLKISNFLYTVLCNVFYVFNSVRLALNIEIINIITQITSIIFHIVRPRAILKIGFIKMADVNHIKNQVLSFSKFL